MKRSRSGNRQPESVSSRCVAGAASARQRGVYWAALIPAAFLLHLAWEFAQCQPFFVHGAIPATPLAMVRATLGDVLLTLLAYFGVAVTVRDLDWSLGRWGFPQWASLMTWALGISVTVEWWSLATGRWGYTDIAPRLPLTPLSALPVMQMLLLLPVCFLIARSAVRRLET